MKKNKFFEGKRPAQAMVEFAIALPVLLLLLYGILEAGRLLFVYSTVVTASRQAARYGSATGVNDADTPHYQDCAGIRESASKVAFFGPFDSVSLAYDQGVNNANPPTSINYTPYCSGATDSSLTTGILQGNRTRLVVTVSETFHPLVKLVPFFERNISATSARTILYSVPIVVEQEQQEWYKVPTETLITSDNPDPSEIEGMVTVTVEVKNIGGGAGSPTGVVHITGTDANCDINLSGSGTGSCDVRFDTAGSKVLTAFYEGDTDHLASSDTEDHEVTIWHTTLRFLSDLPDPSVKGDPFTVVVQVTGGRVTPTGSVDVDGGNGTRCTIQLNNGAGNCTLSFNNVGFKTLAATYNGDSLHLPSNASESHEVILGTPTPTMSPTATQVPSVTPRPTFTTTPTVTPSPTLIPTAVTSCNQITHGAITLSGNTMTMTISNPYPFPVVMNDVTVSWNNTKGHKTGSDKTLKLQKVTVGDAVVWTGNEAQASTKTIPTTAIIPGNPPGTTTITFYFQQSYDNLNGLEKIYINLLTPGCTGNPIDSDK